MLILHEFSRPLTLFATVAGRGGNTWMIPQMTIVSDTPRILINCTGRPFVGNEGMKLYMVSAFPRKGHTVCWEHSFLLTPNGLAWIYGGPITPFTTSRGPLCGGEKLESWNLRNSKVDERARWTNQQNPKQNLGEWFKRDSTSLYVL